MAELPQISENSLESNAAKERSEVISDASESNAEKEFPPIYVVSEAVGTTLRQGEIITNVIQIRLEFEEFKKGNLAADQIIHPFAIILSQDCDCVQDYYARNREPRSNKNEVPSILFGEVHTADWMRSKENPGKIDSDLWKHVKQNKNERYQFLEGVRPECDAEGEGLPELTIDFRRFFSIPTDEFYHRLTIGEAKRRCRLTSPYLEHLAGRFGYFAQRVALPQDHTSI